MSKFSLLRENEYASKEIFQNIIDINEEIFMPKHIKVIKDDFIIYRIFPTIIPFQSARENNILKFKMLAEENSKR